MILWTDCCLLTYRFGVVYGCLFAVCFDLCGLELACFYLWCILFVFVVFLLCFCFLYFADCLFYCLLVVWFV